MNFPYETEKSYLYGGNCLIMEVNPSVPDKPISKKSRIFASDYQSLKKDSNRLFYIQHDYLSSISFVLSYLEQYVYRNDEYHGRHSVIWLLIWKDGCS